MGETAITKPFGQRHWATGWPGRTAFYVLGYSLTIVLGVLVLAPLGLTIAWPANGFLIWGLLQSSRKGRITCAIGCLAINLLTAPFIGFGFVPNAAAAFTNVVECIVMAWLTRRLCGQNLNFSDGRRLFAFLLGAAAPACLLGAAMAEIAGRVLHVAGMGPGVGRLWLVNHVLGAAIVLPATTVIANRRRFREVARTPLEFGGALVAVVLVSAIIFSGRFPPEALALTYPLLMLIAFRYGPLGAASGSLLVCLVSSAAMGLGLVAMPGAGSDLHAVVQGLQFFLAISVLANLPVAGAAASYARLRSLLARRTLIAREARRRADAASAAKSEFLANMSHEIRTPLNGVIGLADALSRTDLAAPQRELLAMILGSGKALTGLLSDALDLARADSGALALVHEPFDVREAIGSAAFLFETIAREKGLGFEVGFDLAPPGAVTGDALRIKQVISNLISNAVKFTARGRVTVQVLLQPSQTGAMRLQVVVRDTGQGFDEMVRARLFNRFEQGDSSVTRRHGGSGLGLSIAHRLCQMMEASLVCDSTPGVGSVFAFSVLLQPAAALASAPAEAEPALAQGRRLSVLLAEDHPVNQRVIEAMLGQVCTLTMVGDGQAALQAFARQSFDLILMDTHMPTMDGLTAIRAIRRTERQAGRAPTPVISLTADAMPQQVEAALAAGADLHLAKPITGAALFSAIDTCLADTAQTLQTAAG